MISRYLTIVLAFTAAVYQASHAAWIQATGLAALGGGLLALRFAPARPALKPLAWVAFLITALAMAVVFVRMRGGR